MRPPTAKAQVTAATRTATTATNTIKPVQPKTKQQPLKQQ